MGKDKYQNFAELQRSEPANAWRKVSAPRGTSVAIVAPHAGGIERGTSELARAIAGEDLSLYLFEGLKSNNNEDLHITSSNFDEPDGVALVMSAVTAVALHGAKGIAPVVYMGGLNGDLGGSIRGRLVEAGFTVEDHWRMQGADADNICNRGKSGRGVQLELTMALRDTFFESMTKAGRRHPTPAFLSFVTAVRGALDAQ